jgi:hypothetical protein
MSALGQKPTCRTATVMSALPLKATWDAFFSDVRYGAIAHDTVRTTPFAPAALVLTE